MVDECAYANPLGLSYSHRLLAPFIVHPRRATVLRSHLRPTKPKVKRTHPHGYMRFRSRTKRSLAAGKEQHWTAGLVENSRRHFRERIFGDVSIKRTMGGA